MEGVEGSDFGLQISVLAALYEPAAVSALLLLPRRNYKHKAPLPDHLRVIGFG